MLIWKIPWFYLECAIKDDRLEQINLMLLNSPIWPKQNLAIKHSVPGASHADSLQLRYGQSSPLHQKDTAQMENEERLANLEAF